MLSLSPSHPLILARDFFRCASMATIYIIHNNNNNNSDNNNDNNNHMTY